MKPIQSGRPAIIEREEGGYASCPELELASQGEADEEARTNLKEAPELFSETVSPEEVQWRLETQALAGDL